jgi:murein L,D-transpeptidase YcbB/YkuD
LRFSNLRADDQGHVGDDLDFDFVDEDTQPAVVTQRPGGLFRRRASAAGGLPPEQVARRRRVAAGIAAGIIVLIVIVVVLTGGSSSPAAAYRSYLARLSPIATDSQQVGRSLSELFSRLRRGMVTNPLTRLDQLTQRARTDLARAEQLKPPAGLRPEHGQALVALDLRARGLQGLHDTIGQLRGSATADTTLVAAEIDRLVTSDVIWHDLVWRPALASLQQLGAKGATAPQSQFITDPNISSQQSITLLLEPQPAASTQSTLTLGANGPAVIAWQKQLNRWLHLNGRTPLTADGTFGPGTQAATQALQRAQGLTPDGVVGPATRRALTAALAGKKTTSKSSG